MRPDEAHSKFGNQWNKISEPGVEAIFKRWHDKRKEEVVQYKEKEKR